MRVLDDDVLPRPKKRGIIPRPPPPVPFFLFCLFLFLLFPNSASDCNGVSVELFFSGSRAMCESDVNLIKIVEATPA